MSTKSFKLSGQRGFSLVELLVVIAVIAIIAAIAIPNIANITQQAKVAKNQRNAQNIVSVATAAIAAGYQGATAWTTKPEVITAITSGDVLVTNNSGGGNVMTFKVSEISADDYTDIGNFMQITAGQNGNPPIIDYVASGNATNGGGGGTN